MAKKTTLEELAAIVKRGFQNVDVRMERGFAAVAVAADNIAKPPLNLAPALEAANASIQPNNRLQPPRTRN